MEYPPFSVYASLYSKYLKGNRSQQLIDLAGTLKGKQVLDLCCGGGRISLLAIANCDYCTSVDMSEDMLQGFSLPEDKGCKVVSTVEKFLTESIDQFDIVFCQQAVTYWITPALAKSLALRVKKGGKFIFNTFNVKPPVNPPLIKHYCLDGANYTEISRLIPKKLGELFDGIEHFQMKEGINAHITYFNWVPRESFIEMLSPWFILEETTENATSCWICTKKD